jgi:tetratricopeptide (TPR) repeat protein
MASRLDVEDCNRAINDATLKKDELIATYVNRGILLMAIEDYAAAAKDYNKALSMSDDVGEAYINRGNLWFMYQKFPEAIEDYNKALKFGVSKPHVAHLNRGMARESLGRLKEAQQDYESALELIPDWMIARQKLDRVSRKLK